MEPSVLFKSSDGAAVVIDIPRSLEEAQVLPGHSITRRIVSTPARETPWQVPEPKKGTTKYASPSTAIAELMTLESVKAALDVVRAHYAGPWCLPRVTVTRKQAHNSPEPIGADESKTNANTTKSHKRKYEPSPFASKQGKDTSASPIIPERSCYLLGTIESRREAFLEKAPQFDLIVLDPPWPSRSVRRKADSYTTLYGTEDARELLLQIPISSHLKRDGMVAIWVTNKGAVTDLLTGPGGILARWGVELIGEWIWVKTTGAGEPVLDIESTWRKPWERLLIARKVGSHVSLPMSTKVIFGVPDVHSRKPSVRGLFEDILRGDYTGLEVFARNLTAGWWSWGNEALLFQQRHHWVPIEDEQAG